MNKADKVVRLIGQILMSLLVGYFIIIMFGDNILAAVILLLPVIILLQIKILVQLKNNEKNK
ncbi:hypothetical protein JCM19046_1640 [Bacillus sp. JCM 19046]|nr:hypothetical protein JCM19045_223 [Bacillus sp. JCM 19045]GAF17150.1 hypothetical protein JCM19046_1640 [Bacillus sp. JCM 19046]